MPSLLSGFLTSGDVCVFIVFLFLADICRLRLFLLWWWCGDLFFAYVVVCFISCSDCHSCNFAL
jgi:hypothetical protein